MAEDEQLHKFRDNQRLPDTDTLLIALSVRDSDNTAIKTLLPLVRSAQLA
ncbi:MAG: hypothetical protein NTY67_00020 [Cyanobacteria bacterium]|nr:hypothetical protein [Cyanobacteriota bacterium]